MHDALVMGPRQGPDTVTPHTRPPADDDAEHLLVRTVECLEGTVEVELVCEPAFDYGRVRGHLDAGRRRGPPCRRGRRRRRGRSGSAPTCSIGIEGGAARARHVLTKGDKAFCALSWAEGLAGPSDVAEADAHDRRHRPVLAQLAGACPDPRPPRCGTRSSGRRSPSRASPTCRPARPWPR